MDLSCITCTSHRLYVYEFNSMYLSAVKMAEILPNRCKTLFNRSIYVLTTWVLYHAFCQWNIFMTLLITGDVFH